MSETKAILEIIVGCAMIVCGLMIKQFYAAKGMYGAVLSDRRIATWKGRLLFLIIGVVMVLAGAHFLLSHQQ